MSLKYKLTEELFLSLGFSKMESTDPDINFYRLNSQIDDSKYDYLMLLDYGENYNKYDDIHRYHVNGEPINTLQDLLNQVFSHAIKMGRRKAFSEIHEFIRTSPNGVCHNYFIGD